VAQCNEVDIASQGETEEEAIANRHEALELHYEALTANEAAVLSEQALADEWNRPEEDAAWQHLQLEHDN
jgi:predicted RNase H-like HicB family nuclease